MGTYFHFVCDNLLVIGCEISTLVQSIKSWICLLSHF